MTHTLIKTMSLAIALLAVLIAPELASQNDVTETNHTHASVVSDM